MADMFSDGPDRYGRVFTQLETDTMCAEYDSALQKYRQWVESSYAQRHTYRTPEGSLELTQVHPYGKSYVCTVRHAPRFVPSPHRAKWIAKFTRVSERRSAHDVRPEYVRYVEPPAHLSAWADVARHFSNRHSVTSGPVSSYGAPLPESMTGDYRGIASWHRQDVAIFEECPKEERAGARESWDGIGEILPTLGQWATVLAGGNLPYTPCDHWVKQNVYTPTWILIAKAAMPHGGTVCQGCGGLGTPSRWHGNLTVCRPCGNRG